MPRKAKPDQGNDNQGETTQGYFRRIFHENPKLLKTRSNDEVLKRWLQDHPGEREVSPSVKNGLQNVKSILRSRSRKRRAGCVCRRRRSARQPSSETPRREPERPGGSRRTD
jgi:hypothetical protein